MIDPETAVTIPLKLKNRNPNSRVLHRPFDPQGGTLIYYSSGYSSKTSNAGTASKVKTLKPRRRAYGPW